MKKILLTTCVIAFSCATFVSHPVTGEKIAIPPNYENKIDFDLTLTYINPNSNDNSEFISVFEKAGLSIDLKSISPLLGTIDSELKVIAEGNANTWVRLNLKELKKGEIMISILPTYGGAQTGTTQKWIIKESKADLIKKLDDLLNPIGFEKKN